MTARNPLEAAFVEATQARAAELRADTDRQQAVIRDRELRHERNQAEAVAAFETAFALADEDPNNPNNNTQED